MKGKVWIAALTGIFIAIGMRIEPLPAQANRASRPFSFNFGASSHSGNSSALGRSWFFTPGFPLPGRGWNSGFFFGAGSFGFGRTHLGINDSLTPESLR